MQIDRDAWLSGIFGYDAFKVCLEKRRPFVLDVGEALAEHQLLRLDGSSVRPLFYYAKVPTQRVDLVQALARSGFGVVDVSVTLECDPARPETKFNSQSIIVRDCRPEDHQAVLDIAGSCFASSRFHLDPEIPFALAHAIKRAWVESYLKKCRGEKLLVAERNGRAVGFLAVLAAGLDGAPCRAIDLIGVDRDHQGCGVGKALVLRFMEEAAGSGAVLRVGTQAANLRSIRLYESLGFKIAQTAYVLHSHVKPTRCLG